MAKDEIRKLTFWSAISLSFYLHVVRNSLDRKFSELNRSFKAKKKLFFILRRCGNSIVRAKSLFTALRKLKRSFKAQKNFSLLRRRGNSIVRAKSLFTALRKLTLRSKLKRSFKAKKKTFLFYADAATRYEPKVFLRRFGNLLFVEVNLNDRSKNLLFGRVFFSFAPSFPFRFGNLNDRLKAKKTSLFYADSATRYEPKVFLLKLKRSLKTYSFSSKVACCTEWSPLKREK